MGAYTPLPWAPAGLVDEVLRDRAAADRRRDGRAAARRSPGCCTPAWRSPPRGTRVVEFNARFGDPETQPLLALLDSPLGALLLGAATGTLADVPRRRSWKPAAAVAVVLASRGYPESSSSGDVITGIEAAEAVDGVHVIQAGTALRRRRTWSPPAAGCSPWSAPAPTSPPPAPRRTPGSPRSRSTAPSTARDIAAGPLRRWSEGATRAASVPGPGMGRLSA